MRNFVFENQNEKTMKTFRISVAVLLLTATAAVPVTAQTQSRNKAWREAAKQEARRLKAEQRAVDSLDFLKAVAALDQGEFVLEAERLRLKHGQEGIVSTTTNFIALHDGQATIQVSPSYSGGGPNGVGGITVEGTPSNTVHSIDKRGNHHYAISVTGTGVSAQVTIDLAEGACNATATVSPNFNSFTTTLIGRLVPFAESDVFKGRAL